MPQIYDRPVHQLIRDMIAERLTTPTAILTRQEALGWFAERYPKVRPGTVAAHLIRIATNDEVRLHHSSKPGYDDVLFKIGPGRYRRYNAETDPLPIRENANPPAGPTSGIEDGDEEDVSTNEFAYETDLRNYLAKNLGRVEPGLTLYEEDGITGIEFPVGGRRIDILAVDRDDNYVVVELKVSRGYDRVVGQLLRYMGWIQANHADSKQRVRGVIVARQITDDLRLACSRIDDVTLFEYELKVDLALIPGITQSGVGVA